MRDTVLLVPAAAIDGAIRDLVTEACRLAQVDCAVLDPGAVPPHPSLVVAGLPAGERRVPTEVAMLLAHRFPGVPLLLLCNEPLVRPSVTLHNGRVCLIGEPLNAERLSGRIRTALAGEGPVALPVGTSSPLRVKEYRGREWWTGVVGRRAASEGAVDPFPAVTRLGRQGLLGVLPLNPDRAPAPAVGVHAAEALLAQPSGEGMAFVKESVGDGAAAVWFAASTSAWALYLPEPSRAWLVSALRLPGRWAVPSQHSWRRLAAGSGDVLVAWSVQAAPGLDGDVADGTLFRVAEGGGPAVLTHLETRLGQGTAAGAAIVVEVR